MKRLFSLLLAISMLLSLTIPAFAEEVVEEIVEEVVEEIQEEVIEEEPAEPETEEIAEEIVEELTEEPAEEVVEEVLSFSSSSAVADSVAEAADEGPDLNMLCELCTQAQNKPVLAAECRVNTHGFGRFNLYLNANGIVQMNRTSIIAGTTKSFDMLLGNNFSQTPIFFQDMSWDKEFVDYQRYQFLNTITYDTDMLTISPAMEGDNMLFGIYDITAKKTGTTAITYQYNGETFSVTIDCLSADSAMFYAVNAGYPTWGSPFNAENPIRLREFYSSDINFFYETRNGIMRIPPNQLYSTTNGITGVPEGPNGDITRLTLASGTHGYIMYRDQQGREFRVRVCSEDGFNLVPDAAPELLAVDGHSNQMIYDDVIGVGATVSRTFRLGSFGMSVPVNNVSWQADEKVATVTMNNGVYTIQALGTGTVTFTYGQNQTHTVEIVSFLAGKEKLFWNYSMPDPFGNYMANFLELRMGDNNGQGFWATYYFGEDISTAKTLRSNDLTILDTSVAVIEDVTGNSILIKPLKEGRTSIAYTDPVSGLQYCMPVKVISGGQDNTNLKAQNSALLPGNILVSTAVLEGENLVDADRFGKGFIADNDPSNDQAFQYTLALKLMVPNQTGVYSELADPEIYQKLKDVRVELLSCVNGKNEPTSGIVSVGNPFSLSIPHSNAVTKAVNISATPSTHFLSMLAVSFTMDNQRYTLQVSCTTVPPAAVSPCMPVI